MAVALRDAKGGLRGKGGTKFSPEVYVYAID